MRPLFADAVPQDELDDQGDLAVSTAAERARERRYSQWRRTRVLFMKSWSEPGHRPVGDLPPQRTRVSL